MFESRCPTTGVLLETVAPWSSGVCEEALAGALAAQTTWAARPLAERTRTLRNVAAALRMAAPDWAALAAREMGKPVAQGRAEVEKCAWVCEHYADRAASYLAPRQESGDGFTSEVRYEPLGVVLSVMPWNFPFWQVFRVLAPALAVGNAVAFKPAPSVPGCGRAIEELVVGAGAPDGLVTALFCREDDVGALVQHPAVAAVTLTGSTKAGSVVGAQAGAAIKPVVLELGGSDPFLVFEDADLERAVATCIASRALNAGQSCIAAKRILVAQSVFERFVEELARGVAALRVGDPLSDVDMGPLCSLAARDRLAEQLSKLGGQVIAQAAVPSEGAYFPPTVLTGAPLGAVGENELFGPVWPVWSFADEDEAVRAAHDTPYGLGASVWTRSPERVARLTAALRVGAVFFNEMVKSDPRVPFGGVARSGVGRELGPEGAWALANIKTVWHAS